LPLFASVVDKRVRLYKIFENLFEEKNSKIKSFIADLVASLFSHTTAVKLTRAAPSDNRITIIIYITRCKMVDLLVCHNVVYMPYWCDWQFKIICRKWWLPQLHLFNCYWQHHFEILDLVFKNRLSRFWLQERVENHN